MQRGGIHIRDPRPRIITVVQILEESLLIVGAFEVLGELSRTRERHLSSVEETRTLNVDAIIKQARKSNQIASPCKNAESKKQNKRCQNQGWGGDCTISLPLVT